MKSCICRGNHAPARSDDDGIPLTEFRDIAEGEDNEGLRISESPRPHVLLPEPESSSPVRRLPPPPLLPQPPPQPQPPPPAAPPLLPAAEGACDDGSPKKEGLQQEKRASKKRMVRQEWSFTLYDFDGRGEVTRDDLSTIMKSLSEVLGSQAKASRERRGFQLRLTMSEEQEAMEGRKPRTRQSRSEKRQRRLTQQAESCPKDAGRRKEGMRRKRDSKSCDPPSGDRNAGAVGAEDSPQQPETAELLLTKSHHIEAAPSRPDKRQRHRERRELAMNHVTDWLLRDGPVSAAAAPFTRREDPEQERCILPDDRVPKVVIHEHKHVHEHHHYHHPCQS